jgi:seryl-tRNA synthetase
LKRRGEKPQSKKILFLDKERRTLIEELELLKAERNRLSSQIGISKIEKKDVNLEEIRKEMTLKKITFLTIEEKLKKIEKTLETLLLNLPNILDDDVPEGISEINNIELSKIGIIRQFGFKPLEHFRINAATHGLNFKEAAVVSGSRFVFLSGAMALLHRAISQFMLNTHILENCLEEIWAPVLVKESAMLGTGQLPKFKTDSYKTSDGLWLIPTAEVPLTNIGTNKIYEISELPKRMTSVTQCFRSEAGSAGKDTSGIIRQHQFEKVEMVTYCVPSESSKELERMTNSASLILEKLQIPYRKVLLCSGDTGFGAKKRLMTWRYGFLVKMLTGKFQVALFAEISSHAE